MTDPHTDTHTHNFRFAVYMKKMTDPPPTQTISDLVWTWTMTNPPPPTQFQIWPGHGKMTDPPFYTKDL